MRLSINGNIIANPGFVEQFGTGVNADGETYLEAPILSAWSAIMSIGQIIGMTSLPFLSDRFGRKAAMYTYWFILAMSITAESAGRSWPAWLAAKLLAGIGVGCLQTTVPTYIAETAPIRIRGGLLMTYNFWFGLANFFAPVALVSSTQAAGSLSEQDLLLTILKHVMSRYAPNNWLTPILTQWGQIGLRAPPLLSSVQQPP